MCFGGRRQALKKVFLSPSFMCVDVCVHGDDVALKGYCASMTGTVNGAAPDQWCARILSILLLHREKDEQDNQSPHMSRQL